MNSQFEKETKVIRDKRTSRKEHKKIFTKIISQIRQSTTHQLINYNHQQQKKKKNNSSHKRFSVYVRKRPIFQNEIKKGEYDVVSVYPINNSVTVHNCKMRADLKIGNAFVENITFRGFENVFSEMDDNDKVYEKSIMPLIQYILSGKRGVCFMFGQTGSGKTYTIMNMMEHAISDIFMYTGFLPNLKVVVSSFEMSGDKIEDLLNRRNKLVLREDQNGVCHVRGINEILVGDKNQLLTVIKQAFKSRKTFATKVNSVSSRSHCIFKISIRDIMRNLIYSELSLVDLAGSERNEDSFHHKKNRIVESCKINSSLMALKECIRIYNHNHTKGGNSFIPYRQDVLTRYLKDCFSSDSMRTVVITCVSPSPTDTEHTLSSLRNTCLMNEKSKIDTDIVNVAELCVIKNDNQVMHPQKWTVEQTFDWISTIRNGRYKKYIDNFPTQLDGKQLCRFSKKRFSQICNGKQRMGENLCKELQKEIQKFNDQKRQKAKDLRQLNQGNRNI